MKETYVEFLGTYIKGIIWAPVMYGHFNLHTYDTQELIQEMKKKKKRKIPLFRRSLL